MAVIIENKIPTIASIADNVTGRLGIVDRFGGMFISELTHLVGGEFGSALDTRKWLTLLANGGTVTVTGGEAIVATNTTANGAATLFTNRAGRFLSSNVNRFLGGIRLNNTGVTNNRRRWGVSDAIAGVYANGLFFELNGITPAIVSTKASVDTVVTSFNGSSPFVSDTNQHTYEIHISGGKQQFFQDSLLIHTITAATSSSIAVFALKPTFETINSGGITSNNTLILRGQALSRFGQANSRPDFYRTTANETVVLKIGAGTLRKILISNGAAGSTTIYNNTAASGEIISVLDNAVETNYDFDLDFDIGLTFVTATGTGDITFLWD